MPIISVRYDDMDERQRQKTKTERNKMGDASYCESVRAK